MTKRTAIVRRKTKETNVFVRVNLDGIGKYEVDTGIGFLNHMLELLSKHSLIDLSIRTKGDLNVDDHHTVEDVGICLGDAIRKALGSKRGIERYGFLSPMDEALAEVSIDLSGRPYLVWNITFRREKIGDMSTELFEDFFRAIANNLQAAIHVNLKYGRNEHHMIESIFKAFAKALKFAVKRDEGLRELLPSTKGRL